MNTAIAVCNDSLSRSTWKVKTDSAYNKVDDHWNPGIHMHITQGILMDNMSASISAYDKAHCRESACQDSYHVDHGDDKDGDDNVDSNGDEMMNGGGDNDNSDDGDHKNSCTCIRIIMFMLS